MTTHGIDLSGETILVFGRGPSSVDAVRAAECDWTLIPYAAPHLRAMIDAAKDEREAGGDVWLVAIEVGHAAELDRDRAVIGYAPAWRPTSY